MQAKVQKEASFQPFDLNITFESKEEAEAVYRMFRHSYVVESAGLPKYKSVVVLKALGPYIDIANSSYDYAAHHKRLKAYFL